jgi:hypothetical protein
MRHNFAIERLGRSKRFKPQRYTYFCIRCHWIFLVEGWKAYALNESSQPLSEPENGERASTFAVGPCPAAPPEYILLRREIPAAVRREWIVAHYQPSDRGLLSFLLRLFRRRPAPSLKPKEVANRYALPPDVSNGASVRRNRPSGPFQSKPSKAPGLTISPLRRECPRAQPLRRG